MTGYQSKRAAAQDKLETWDTPSEAFNEWWDSDYDDSTNPYEKDTFAYWAWAGWQAALAKPAQAEVLAQAVPDETLTIVYQSGFYDGKKQQQLVEPTGNEWFEWWRVSQVADETEAEIDFADFLIIAQAVAAKLKEQNNG